MLYKKTNLQRCKIAVKKYVLYSAYVCFLDDTKTPICFFMKLAKRRSDYWAKCRNDVSIGCLKD